MNISVRLFFGYFLIVGLAAWFVLNVVTHETEPGVRQATEETLVDTAHVLAEMAALDLSADRIGQGAFADSVRAAIRRSPQADISGVLKEHVDFRIYVTDAQGIVVYDSKQAAVGEDFSQWRDIARVLRGEYGARQSREDPYDPASSVMHVAAPIFWQGELIGVLSLAKPMSSVAPYAERAAQRVKQSGLILLAASAAIGLTFTLWLGWSIHRLRDYARAVTEGRKAEAPTGGGRQLSELAQALATMREKLEGKQYVERYVQNLAHELKSPLTAILGAAQTPRPTPPAPPPPPPPPPKSSKAPPPPTPATASPSASPNKAAACKPSSTACSSSPASNNCKPRKATRRSTRKPCSTPACPCASKP